ncbi:MAG TPA: hypothetical protein VMX13_06025 [Sedimentisphaerales bacterium]|nr:hypothetical protein [Sedimentisphaerales bacterium]
MRPFTPQAPCRRIRKVGVRINVIGAVVLLWAILAALFFMFGRKRTIQSTNTGVIETNLTAEQVSQATMAFINDRGWSHVDDRLRDGTILGQTPAPSKALRRVVTPDGDEIIFEWLTEATGPVVIYITGNSDSAEPELTTELAEYLETRFGRRLRWY